MYHARGRGHPAVRRARLHASKSRIRSSITLLAVLTLCACQPDVGECDRAAAQEIVYTVDGTPAFAGQALVNQSCGGGGFCHARDIPVESRVGAPIGLEFDLNIASATVELNAVELERLFEDQLTLFRHRHSVLEQVQRGLMPPSGEESDMVLASVLTYDRVADDGTTFAPLPTIDTDEGQEILRNWIACDTPVVERTVEITPGIPYPYRDPVTDEATPIGFTIPTCGRRCVDPTWPDIVEQILLPTCALSRCHDSDEPVAMLDLSVADPTDAAQLASLHERLTADTAVAQGLLCSASDVADTPMFVPEDPDGSLMFLKLGDPAPCGSPMPEGSPPLNEQRICAIREWIACGACADPADATCAGCVATARATCGVVLDMATGEPQCEVQEPCARFPATDGEM